MENKTLDEKTIEALKSEHGEIYLLSAELPGETVEVVIKRPQKASVKRFVNTLSNEERRYEAFEALLKDVAVYPARPRLDEVIGQYPGLVLTLGEPLAKIAGSVDKADFRKL